MLREQADQIVFYVGDNGPGIPTEDHTRIFEKFYRSKDVSKEVQGTGLGLAIVKTIVDNHRGRIWVDSTPGNGSIFTVVLPIAK
jgi:signal transduction histidine kinase